MMRHIYAFTFVLLGFVPSYAVGQTSPTPPLVAFDEAILRQAGIGADAASLLNLVREQTRTDGDADKIKALIEQMASPQFAQREEAEKALIAAGRPALDALRQARKKHVDPEVRIRAGHCIAAVESLLDANLVLAAVRRLIHLRAAGAAEPLLLLLPTVDWEIQDEIFHGLPRVALRDRKLDPALLAALEDKSPLCRAAAALAVAQAGNDDDRVRVRKLMQDSDATVRLRAAQGLLAAHEESALPVLIALLNEPLVEISWSAEELLHWVAGTKSPPVAVGAASIDSRKKAIDAWNAWHKAQDKIDWDQIEQAARRPLLYLACDKSSVWLGGCTGLRCQLTTQTAHDAYLLPDNHLFFLPYGNVTELVKCDLAGQEVWHRRQHNTKDYVMCQRLPNGNFLLVSCMDAVEMTLDGKEVSGVTFVEEAALGDAWQPRRGPMVCRLSWGLCAIDRSSGRAICGGDTKGRTNDQEKFAVLPDGRCAVADRENNRLLEADASGQLLRVLRVAEPRSVEALRDGHYLVSTYGERRLLELDQEGRTLWEIYAPQQIHRVRSILDRVRIGFDKPRPADFDLDSVAHRVFCLKDPRPTVRVNAVAFLQLLRPTDDNSLAALAAALDDPVQEVRRDAATALASFGEPSVPSLTEVLKTGKAEGRLAAAGALEQIGPAAREAVPDLLAVVKDDNERIELRRRAIGALGEIGPDAKNALPALLAALKSDTPDLYNAAATSLVSIAPNDRRVLEGLRNALGNANNAPSQEAALRALEHLGPKAKDALPLLIDTLKAPTVLLPLRCRALKAVASMEIEAKPALPVLVELLTDAKQPMELRCYCAHILGELGPTGQPALPAFRDLLHDPELPEEMAEALAEGLGRMGKDAVPILIGAVKERKTTTRCPAIRMLGKLAVDAVPALPALEDATRSGDDHIVKLARVAIFNIERHRDTAIPLN